MDKCATLGINKSGEVHNELTENKASTDKISADKSTADAAPDKTQASNETPGKEVGGNAPAEKAENVSGAKDAPAKEDEKSRKSEKSVEDKADGKYKLYLRHVLEADKNVYYEDEILTLSEDDFDKNGSYDFSGSFYEDRTGIEWKCGAVESGTVYAFGDSTDGGETSRKEDGVVNIPVTDTDSVYWLYSDGDGAADESSIVKKWCQRSDAASWTLFGTEEKRAELTVRQ